MMGADAEPLSDISAATGTPEIDRSDEAQDHERIPLWPRRISVAALIGSVALAVLIATPAGRWICEQCGKRSEEAFRRIAAVGAAGLGAALFAIALAGSRGARLAIAGTPLALAVGAHAGLIFVRTAEACAACWTAFGLELAAAAAFAAAIAAAGTRPGAVAVLLVALLAGGAVGATVVPAWIDSMEGPQAEAPATRTSAAASEEATSRARVVACLHLREGCSRCAWYLENVHPQVEEMIAGYDDIVLEIHWKPLPGQIEPGAYPAVHLYEEGSTRPFSRIEPIRSLAQLQEGLELFRGGQTR